MHSASEFPAPVIPGYTVGRLLGRGGTAQVWLVTDERTGQMFAAKVLTGPPAGSGDESVKGDRNAVSDDGSRAGMLHREMRLLHRFSHEHLVHAHEVMVQQGSTILLMDYAAGGSLADLVAARGPLPVAEVVTIISPIAGCLAYLHAHGMTHSDVAPGNILFTEYGKPMLADPALGSLTGEHRRERAGTAGFADPAGSEIRGSRAGTGGSSDGSLMDAAGSLATAGDVYALGALTWYALTGRVPAAALDRPPLSILVPDVPRELALSIESALQQDPEQRPSAAEYEQAVFRSRAAAPVDLVGVVHESVLPQLLTRRIVHHGQRRRGPVRLSRPVVIGILAVLGAGGGLALVTAPGADKSVSAGPAASQKAPPSVPAVAPSVPAIAPPPSVPAGLRSRLASDDPLAAARALAALRSYAYTSGKFDLLNDVNAAGSDAMAAEQAVVQRLNSTGHVLEGLRMSIERAQLLPADAAGTVLVSATVSTSAYTQRDSGGDLVHRIQAGEQKLTLALVRKQGRWLIDRILASTAES